MTTYRPLWLGPGHPGLRPAAAGGRHQCAAPPDVAAGLARACTCRAYALGRWSSCTRSAPARDARSAPGAAADAGVRCGRRARLPAWRLAPLAGPQPPAAAGDAASRVPAAAGGDGGLGVGRAARPRLGASGPAPRRRAPGSAPAAAPSGRAARPGDGAATVAGAARRRSTAPLPRRRRRRRAPRGRGPAAARPAAGRAGADAGRALARARAAAGPDLAPRGPSAPQRRVRAAGAGRRPVPARAKLRACPRRGRARRRPLVVVNAGSTASPGRARTRCWSSGLRTWSSTAWPLAAHAVGARDARCCGCTAASPRPSRALQAALDQRAAAGRPGPRIRIVQGPPRYVAGEASAVVRHLSGGPARPARARRMPPQHGVDGRPTLVVQRRDRSRTWRWSLRHGPAWFRLLGPPTSPGRCSSPSPAPWRPRGGRGRGRHVAGRAAGRLRRPTSVGPQPVGAAGRRLRRGLGAPGRARRVDVVLAGGARCGRGRAGCRAAARAARRRVPGSRDGATGRLAGGRGRRAVRAVPERSAGAGCGRAGAGRGPAPERQPRHSGWTGGRHGRRSRCLPPPGRGGPTGAVAAARAARRRWLGTPAATPCPGAPPPGRCRCPGAYLREVATRGGDQPAGGRAGVDRRGLAALRRQRRLRRAAARAARSGRLGLPGGCGRTGATASCAGSPYARGCRPALPRLR